ncbi:MAG TPA: hypothetical protein VFC71_01445 [Candidatus Polarisedimenticolia bacterium]|nr:hypothetical protein [Candidatus Polarisedimenticolia bacterium]
MNRRLASALVAIVLLFGLGACNPGPGSSGAPPASYSVPGY